MTDPPVPGEKNLDGTGRRQVYRSTPGTPSPASLMTKFDELASGVYTGLRDGALDTEATFDLACFLMDWGPFSRAVHELAEQSVTGTDPARVADLAGQVLEESGFEPGFDAEPKLLAELEHALEAVKADMQATDMAGPVRFTFMEVPGSYLRNTFADFRGSFAYTGGITPSKGRDRVSALLAVADDVQDAIMGSLMTVWPVCPDHGLGGHPAESGRHAVWWCNGGVSGHVIARIGRWNTELSRPGTSAGQDEGISPVRPEATRGGQLPSCGAAP